VARYQLRRLAYAMMAGKVERLREEVLAEKDL